MHRIAISGLVALAAVLGGVAVPATATAQPTTSVARSTTVVARSTTAVARPTAAVRAGSVIAMRATKALAAGGVLLGGEPLISCVLSTDCLGAEGSSSQGGSGTTPTRVARWNGVSWKGVGVTLPKGTRSDDLLGASCKGAKSCLVVGDYYTSTSDSAPSHALALFYNGTSLKPTPAVPLPKGVTNVALTSVSCATTRYCVALGQAEGITAGFGGSGSLVIIETWNGAKWTLHAVTVATGKTTAVEPTVVSCAASAFCVLAGEEITVTANSGSVTPYAASWNGKKLVAMRPATVGAKTDFPIVTGVSCATASNCALTGGDMGDLTSTTTSVTAFTETWNGKAWQLAKVTWPKGTALSDTLSVSCYAAHSCEAVGADGASTADTAPFDAAAVSFNGTAGVLQPVPAPPKGHSTAFADVSCLPWGSCVATGATGTTTASSGAVMTGVWNGKAWKLDPGF